MKPGGWIELQDFDHVSHSDDDTIPEKYPYDQFLDMMEWAWGKLGCDCKLAPKVGKLLEDAGFVNISCKMLKAPIGVWPKNP